MRTICKECKEEVAYPAEYLIEIGAPIPKNSRLFRGRGCEHCRQTGYRGRAGLYEVMIVSDEIRSLIVSRAAAQDIRRLAVEQGMHTLRDDGLAKVRAGETTVLEIERVLG